MTAKQAVVAFMVLLLVGLSVHEYWQPEVTALVGIG